jgi:hypothetical protein
LDPTGQWVSKAMSQIPVGRIGAVEEVANLALVIKLITPKISMLF